MTGALTGKHCSSCGAPVYREACDECTKINPKIFAYNAEKKAVVANPRGGPYRDIVRAAEKCTAECIHPGTPFNMNEKDIDKLVKRAEKFQ